MLSARQVDVPSSAVGAFAASPYRRILGWEADAHTVVGNAIGDQGAKSLLQRGSV